MITVYIDVLFMVNFLINILIVEGTGAIMNEYTKWYKSALAAFIGAIYSVLTFFPSLKLVQTFVMKIILSGVIVAVAFKIKSKLHFLKLWGSFYLVSFIFGGGMVAVMSMSGLGAKMGAVYSNGTIYLNLPWQILFASGAGVYFLITVFSRVRKHMVAKEAVARKLSFYIKGELVETKAIIDTGNTLFDPITGSPVIVCEYGEIESIVPVKSGESLIEKMGEMGLKVRLIPFSSIGKERGLMPAFLPDKVKIDEREAKRCIVGISENKLSESEEYHALLNPMIKVK